MLLHQLAFRVDCENPVQRHAYFFIGINILKNMNEAFDSYLNASLQMQHAVMPLNVQ